ncbi:rhamnogalacturonan acetylesterase [Kaistella flava (ex Peng et al. 2021)]|uniref:Rhamnogalacturonan acetylesterase n=2 Tax=Kaistella flava (ex Peng et al. 2021) TaxID=2038776 RepID=A0A7M2YCG9_9FLAO|nr:rhamnogalacturonan acetylesterase [Kaistella flava (ex Peng et al. 2021)]
MKLHHLIIVSILILCSCKSGDSMKKSDKITIFTIGDSTMANKVDPDKNPERGWVQVLPQFFNDHVIIKNHAVNGRSTKSFRTLGHWQKVVDSLKPGNYLFIQFGHNDAKETDSARYTNPQTSYRHNLMNYITEARSKGAIPIMFSSIARRKFNEQGVLLDSHGNYTLIARLVAREMNVPFFDMQYLTENLEMIYGVENSKKLHLHYLPGEHPYYPKGIDDNTHLSVLGATEVAKLFVKELEIQKHPLSYYLQIKN